MTVNTTEPQATDEDIRGGKLEFQFPSVRPGETFTYWMQLQVNPNPIDIGTRHQDVWLYDGSRLLAHVNRTAFVFP